ncbi:MAG: copper homeostasis protein CutC [Bacteroidaceae bacterium]|nr:copper homeostasis protein CutC [Bacteroidaceae bacterium]
MNTLEVCSGTLRSALAAVAGGATRIELCSALSLDGLTPSVATIAELRRRFPSLRIHVLIRPREGDFVYDEAEVLVMEQDIHAAVQAGATAIVSGALLPDNTIDLPVTARLVSAAGGLPFTFHRAFDLVPDQSAALEQLRVLGVRRVLTSGGAPTAEAGIPALRQLVQQAQDDIIILPGGGVNRHNARRILQETGATEIHGSCSVLLPNGLRETSPEEVRAVLDALTL